MIIKKATNSQLSTTESKKNKNKTKQTTRTGTELQNGVIWKVCSWDGEGREWGNGTGIKKHNRNKIGDK